MDDLTPQKHELAERLFKLLSEYDGVNSYNPLYCQAEFLEIMLRHFTESELEEVANPYEVLDYIELLKKRLIKPDPDDPHIILNDEEKGD